MVIRFLHRQGGAHVHVRVFLAHGLADAPGTFAGCGELTFRETEWPDVQRALVNAHDHVDLDIEVKPDEPPFMSPCHCGPDPRPIDCIADASGGRIRAGFYCRRRANAEAHTAKAD